MKLPVAYVDIRASAHATEDLERVKRAIRNLLPEEHTEEIVFKTEALKGHYGNPIVLLETRLEDEALLKKFMENAARRLGDHDKHEVFRSLDRFLRKSDLYLRFDKQAALEKELRLRPDDPIHVRIHFRTSNRETIIDLCRQLGLTP